MIIIFSYNRSQPLLNTLKELHGVDTLIVLDDGSDYDYSAHENYCEYIRTDHKGLRGFWDQWDFAFNYCKRTDHDKFIFIPDDWEIFNTEQIYQTFEVLPDPFGCNVTNCGWQRSWTPIPKHPSQYKGYFRVGWTDHGLITTRKTLEELEWKMDRVSNTHFRNNRSSGVGKQLSTRLVQLGIPLFTPFKSMAQHQGCESVMHPERKTELKPQ